MFPSFWVKTITNLMFVWYKVYSIMLMKCWQMYFFVKHMSGFRSNAKQQKCYFVIQLSGSHWPPCQCWITSFFISNYLFQSPYPVVSSKCIVFKATVCLIFITLVLLPAWQKWSYFKEMDAFFHLLLKKNVTQIIVISLGIPCWDKKIEKGLQPSYR